ncbi:hypothetical protein FORC065_3253 [Yersinia enterocolitica]|nr:hypothetical protein FORC065_3253 [Yersinia enterocolitica]
MKLQGCWLRAFTRITYLCKLTGILLLAAYLQHQLLWVKPFVLEVAGGIINITD